MFSLYSSITNRVYSWFLPTNSDHQKKIITDLPKEILFEIFCNQAIYPPADLALVCSQFKPLSEDSTYSPLISGMFSKHLQHKIGVITSMPAASKVCSDAYRALYSELELLELDPSTYLKQGDPLSCKEADRLIQAKNFCLFYRQISGIDSVKQLSTPEEIYATESTYLAQLQDPSFDPKQMTTLGLKNLGLTRLPEEIGLFTALKSLDLSNNQLVSLPDSFGNLQALQRLYLSSNQLFSLPDSFGNLHALQYLYLSNNKLLSLPDSFGNLKDLQGLYFQDNNLSSLPDSFCNLHALYDLSLANNQLVSLPDSFEELQALQGLYLQNNQLVSFPDSFGKLQASKYFFIENNPCSSFPALSKLP